MSGRFKSGVEKTKAEIEEISRRAEAERLRQAEEAAQHEQRSRDWLSQHLVPTLEAARDEVAEDVTIVIDTSGLNQKGRPNVGFTIAPAKVRQGRHFSATKEIAEVDGEGFVTVGIGAVRVGNIRTNDIGIFEKFLMEHIARVLRMASI